MKIEKLSENQIRCTLNKADLANRELLLNELAYGTEKAQALFRDMMQQASNELGFEANETPLMIEAIPVSQECLILIITKVEDPDELDTRFSKFTEPSPFSAASYSNEDDEDDDDEDDDEDDDSSAINVSDNFSTLKDNQDDYFMPLAENFDSKNMTKDKDTDAISNVYKIFIFSNMNSLVNAAVLTRNIYSGNNCLYKNTVNNTFYLILYRSDSSIDSFNRTCNIISEYGTKIKSTYAMPYYFSEHYKLIINKDALQTLASI